AGFVAYLIEFSRAVAVGREIDRTTADGVLVLAAATVLIWAVPLLRLDDPGLVRVAATQLMLIAGAVVVATVERHVEQTASVQALPDNAAAEATSANPGLVTAEPLLERQRAA